MMVWSSLKEALYGRNCSGSQTPRRHRNYWTLSSLCLLSITARDRRLQRHCNISICNLLHEDFGSLWRVETEEDTAKQWAGAEFCLGFAHALPYIGIAIAWIYSWEIFMRSCQARTAWGVDLAAQQAMMKRQSEYFNRIYFREKIN